MADQEPADTTLAFVWHLEQFADAASDAALYPITTDRTRHRRAEAKARKHARRLMSLAGLYPNDPSSREAVARLLGTSAPIAKTGS